MKILSQIPLLIFILIAYAVIAISSPSWLNIRQTETNVSLPAVEEVDTDPGVIADETPAVVEDIPVEDLFSGTTEKPVFLMKLVSGATWGMTLGKSLFHPLCSSSSSKFLKAPVRLKLRSSITSFPLLYSCFFSFFSLPGTEQGLACFSSSP